MRDFTAGALGVVLLWVFVYLMLFNLISCRRFVLVICDVKNFSTCVKKGETCAVTQ